MGGTAASGQLPLPLPCRRCFPLAFRGNSASSVTLARAPPLPQPLAPPARPAPAPQGAIINVLGAGATMLGLSATIGVLLAKTLTSATVNPFLATSSSNWNPVLAFDVFNVQVRMRVRCLPCGWTAGGQACWMDCCLAACLAVLLVCRCGLQAVVLTRMLAAALRGQCAGCTPTHPS